MVKKNACVFISGEGTNFQALYRYSLEKHFPINIKLLVTSNMKAKGIVFAKKVGIPYLFYKNDRLLNEFKILNRIKQHKISIICLAGFMKILSSNFINVFGKRIINIHPSLLPKFKGLNTFERVLKDKEKKTGCTVHFVNKKLDAGKIILQRFFYISKSDNYKTLKIKTQRLEYTSYSQAIIKVFNK